MTNLDPRNAERAWVGLSRPAVQMVAPGLAVVGTDSRYEVTVPLGPCAPDDVTVDLVDGMLIVSAKPIGAPSEDLDDLFSGERTEALTHYVMLGGDVDKDSISALYLGSSLLVSARRSRGSRAFDLNSSSSARFSG